MHERKQNAVADDASHGDSDELVGNNEFSYNAAVRLRVQQSADHGDHGAVNEQNRQGFPRTNAKAKRLTASRLLTET